MPVGMRGETLYSVEDMRVYPYSDSGYLRRYVRREQARKALPYLLAGLVGVGFAAGWGLRRWVVR